MVVVFVLYTLTLMMSSQSSRRGRKRKSTDVSVEQSPEGKPDTCILHSTISTECGKFTAFNNVANVSQTLRKLHDIRDLRMTTPSLSVHRMEDICPQIQDSLENYNLVTTGYHRGCNQRFVKNINLLQNLSMSS